MRVKIRQALDSLAIAASFAMLASAAQILRNLYVRYVAHGFVRMSDDAIWMTPLSFFVIFFAASAVWTLIPFVTRRVMLVGFGTLAVWSALLHMPRIHALASLVIALGLSVRLAAVIERAPDRRLRHLYRSGLGLAVCFGIVGGLHPILRARAEARTLAARPPAEANAPNVLLIVLDTVRASSMSLYGSSVVTTPFLERLGAESVVFDWAMAPSSWTLPSHASLFTGIPSSQLGVDFRVPLRLEHPTLAEALLNRGYATAAFTANYIFASRESGLTPGFARFEDHAVSFKEILWHANLTQMFLGHGIFHGLTPGGLWRVVSNARHGVTSEPRHELWNANEVIDAFLRWRSQGYDQPYFAFLNLFDAHGEFEPPPPFDESARGAAAGWSRYLRNIAFQDAMLERLVTTLRETGELDRTILVITSDHGHQFGEHGLSSHGNSLYTQVLHVPLLVRYPAGIAAPMRVTAPVSLMNLAATIAVLAGDRSQTVAGLPLVLQPDVPDRPPVLAETIATQHWDGPSDFGPMISVFDERFHYIRRGDGIEELYAYAVDPAETRDLAATVTGQEAIRHLRQLADRLARASRRP